MEERNGNNMEDILKCGLKIVFVGTAIGKESSKKNAYYANRNNRFWDIIIRNLFIKGISGNPRTFKLAKQKEILLKNGLGLTDIIKNTSGNDKDVSKKFSKEAIKSLKEKILKYQPKIVAFNGKQAAKLFYGRKIDYGRHGYNDELNVLFFVLPSTSRVASKYWDENKWKELKKYQSSVPALSRKGKEKPN